MPPLSLDRPTMTMLSSADATEGADFPTGPVPTRFLPCVQYPPLRVNIHAAPTPPLSLDPPTITMLPSAESATEGVDFPTAPAPTSFLSCVQRPPLRVNTNATPPSSANPPKMAILPSADSATDVPWRPTAPVLTSLLPCCVQTPSLRVNTHAAPAAPRPKGTDRSHGLSPGPPTIAVLPSADSATDMPWRALPTASMLTSFLPRCVHTPRVRVNTHAAPVLPLSDHPPTMAVLPSAESATDMPWRAFPTAPLPTSFLPCCVQVAPLRVNTHAPSAPQPPILPTMAVLPSAESATEIPGPGGNGGSLAPLPTSLLPCCVQILPLRVKTHAAPVVLLSLGPPMMAVLPSEERATDAPWDHNPPPCSLVVPTSLPPCCVQVPPLRVNTHAAPAGPTTGDRSRSARSEE